ncbi:MAG: hypothetical protein HRU77_15460 [Gammaproteobacteria bacterium]|nr:MAG: hypothetical protein HRU77_15460 [Gammaproteobacteria bacterium]
MAEIIKYEEPKLPALPEKVMPAINELVASLGIPREVLASDEEIEYAWKDLPRELKQIPPQLRGELVARMCVAVSTGLFDGAVNYAWNAAILHLRDKVRNFGLPVVAQILASDFEEKHLLELQDSKLLELCLKLNLINEDGFFFLDQCRDVRNNFSAAHPTLGKINDREFVTFLNRCTKYALGESSSPRGVDISAYITAIKNARFSGGQCQIWIDRLTQTHDAQRQLLIGMAHGIYCDPSTPEPARLNSLDICFALKEGFTASVKSDLINKHSEYLAKGDEKRYIASQQFFEKLGLLGLLNESEQHAVFSRAIERLMTAHLALNNFYNEPPFAERLSELSRQGEVPETAQEAYVSAVVGCYIGNGYGVSWAAEPYYKKMIESFSPREISHMIKLAGAGGALNRRISSNTSCKSRYKEALNLIDAASVPSGVKADYETFLK